MSISLRRSAYAQFSWELPNSISFINHAFCTSRI
nr:MAG TPA: hypothetical protein [Caudoviricetes sp.]